MFRLRAEAIHPPSRWGPGEGASQDDEAAVRLLKDLLAAFNRHDLDAIMEFFAEDAVMRLPRGPEPWGRMYTGKSAIREGVASRFMGIPDVSYTEDQHFASGDRGASEWTLRGTTRDAKRIEVRGCDLYTFRDGKVVHKDSFWKIVE